MGNTADLWDFEFLPPPANFKDEAEAPKYEGQRKITASRWTGRCATTSCSGTRRAWGRRCGRSRSFGTSSTRITGLVLADGSRVEAKYYIDAAGNIGLFHRAMGVSTHRSRRR